MPMYVVHCQTGICDVHAIVDSIQGHVTFPLLATNEESIGAFLRIWTYVEAKA